MSVTSGPLVSTNNLVFNVDAASTKSYAIPKTTEHGISDWYCFETGTATYSASYPGTTIYQIDDNGTLTVMVPTTSIPQRGTFTVTAGYRYFGTRPINIVIENRQHALVPLSMTSNVFMYLASRVGSELGTMFFYAPYGATTVNVYKGGAGISGTPVATYNVTARGSATHAITATDWYYVTANRPIIASAGQLATDSDKTILSPPVTNGVYCRFQTNVVTTVGGTPTGNGAFVTYDTTYPSMNQNIADGAGGDCAQGLGLNYLCDSYSWGNVMSDYVIVSPHELNTVICSYWDGSKWVVWDTHVLTGGSQYNPAQVQRDGSAGPGTTATAIQGSAANAASGATLWKWEGTLPFFLGINDSYDDEFAVLGWMSNNSYRKSTNSNGGWVDSIGTQNAYMANPPVYDSANAGTLIFNGSDTNVFVPYSATLSPTLAETIEIWAYAANWSAITGDYRLASKTEGGGWQIALSGGNISNLIHMKGTYRNGPAVAASTLSSGWHHFVLTCDGRYIRLYIDTAEVSTWDDGSYGALTYATNNNFYIGAESFGGAFDSGGTNVFPGKISGARLYSKALSVTEIKNNFNASRSRFGI